METQNKYDIFISWRNDTNDIGKRIADRLKVFIEEDVFTSEVAVFASNVDLKENWNDELENALNTSEYGIMILTPEAMDSFWMSYEYGVLRGRGKKINSFHFSTINRDKTPFTISQDLEFNYKNLLDFLKKIYSRKNPQVRSFDAFERRFRKEWDAFHNDINSYVQNINKDYKRNHILCGEFKEKLNEKEVEKEKLRDEIKANMKNIALLNNEVNTLQTKIQVLEKIHNSDNIKIINELNDSNKCLSDELFVRQTRIDELEKSIQDIENVKQEIQKKEIIISEQENTIEQLQKQKRELNGLSMSNKQKVVSLTNAIKALNEEKKVLNYKISELDFQVDRLKKEHPYKDAKLLLIVSIFLSLLIGWICIESYHNEKQKYIESAELEKKRLEHLMGAYSDSLQRLKVESQEFQSKYEQVLGEKEGYVDLGLSSGTLWATCNLGAQNPWEYGDYFAWGETKPKTTYTWDSYKHANKDKNKLTKYCFDENFGNGRYTDNLSELEVKDDAAAKKTNWRTPSLKQFQELIDCCDWQWTKEHGVNGYVVTSKKNKNNHIFLPASGDQYGDSIKNRGDKGFYWSLSYFTNSRQPYSARCVNLEKDTIVCCLGTRCFGFSIRPVRTKK